MSADNRPSTESRLRALQDLALPDDAADIEGPTLPLGFDAGYDLNFKDAQGLESKWAEECTALAEIEDIVKKGDNFISMLYSWRSITNPGVQLTMPQPGKPAKDDPKMLEVILDVVTPEIKKIKEFYDWSRAAVAKYVSYIGNYSNTKEKRRPSDVMVWNMCRVVDVMALLDRLKSVKSAMTNDFTYYKRQMAKSQSVTDSKELSDIGMWLNRPESILLELLESLKKLTEPDPKRKEASPLQDVLVHFANLAADWVDTNHFSTPKEKYMLLRCIPYFLYLADDANEPIARVKTLRVSQYTKLFKKYPIVPLYGDLTDNLVAILNRAPTIKNDSSNWDASVNETKSALEYNVFQHLMQLRAAYNTYMAVWNSTLKEVKLQQRQSGAPLGTVNETLASQVRDVILQGFQLLTDWTGRVLSQAAWKYQHQNGDGKLKGKLPYELMVRYNYDSNEKFALIEVIAMLKSLAALMLREDAMLAPIIRSLIHDEIQQFIQVDLRDMLRHTAKNKDKFRQTFSELQELRLMIADWKDGQEPNDSAMRGEKENPNEALPMIPKRAVPPSPTQLTLFRSQIFGLLTEPRKKTGFMGDKDLTDAHTKTLEAIYDKSFFYASLINYSNTVRNITDLGDLWYREWGLDISKRIQFEIDMSLPWILCDHVLESNNLSLIDSILYPLDIYNDAAQRALSALKQQYLFDEIEAEVNLAFDQLIYKLADLCYGHYKTLAACMTMDKDLRHSLEAQYPDRASRFNPPKSRLNTLFSQRHFQLLGRSLDLNDLLSQRMNTSLRANLNGIIAKFEASPITQIVECENLLNVTRLTHSLLQEDGLALDPWDSIYHESNASSSIRSFHGRVVLHVVFEFVSDLAPNFIYTAATNRFTRAPPLGRQEEVVLRENMPKLNPRMLYGNRLLSVAFQQHWELFSHFFGMPHIEAIYRVIGKESMPLVMGELLSNLSLKLGNVLEPYISELARGMPTDVSKTKLPPYQYGATGAMAYWRGKLAQILAYPVLVTEVFHQFREWGNGVILFSLLDAGASAQDSSSFVLSAPFLGVTPPTPTSAGGKKGHAATAAAATDDSTTRPSYPDPSPLLHTIKSISSILEKKPEIVKSSAALPILLSSAAETERLYQLPSTRHTLLRSALQGLSDMITPFAARWGPAAAADNLLLPIEQSLEFYRVWSAMLFAFLIDVEDNERNGFNKTSFELFGEGFLWAGTTIVHFLGQRARFEAFDFSHHMGRIAEAVSYDERSTLPGGPGQPPSVNWTALFLQQRFPDARDTIKRVFHILQSNFPVDFRPAAAALVPPATDAQAGTVFVAPAQV